MSETDLQKTVKWPDMSAYGIYFGVIPMADSEHRVVMVDVNDQHAQLAEAAGFKRAAIQGIWFKRGKSFSLPAGVREDYPNLRVVRVSELERDQAIVGLLKKMKARSKSIEAGQVRAGWKPGEKVSQSAVPAQESPVSVAVSKTVFCGLNPSGHEVFETADGARFVKSDGKVIANEQDAERSSLFLRAQSATDRAGLMGCARGMVVEMQRNKLRSQDFSRYLNAALGAGADQDEHSIVAFHSALDDAMVEAITLQADANSAEERFAVACRLQEMRPAFYRPDGTHPTALPVSALMQAIVLARMDQDGRMDAPVVDFDAGKTAQHSWGLSGEAASATIDAVPSHAYAVGGIYGSPIAQTEIDGVSAERADHAGILRSLLEREPEGMSVFTFSVDDKTGEVSPATRRLISWIGARYEISGMVDMDPSMIGEGVQDGARMLVVSNRKSEIDHAFSPPARLNVLFGYEELHDWGQAIVGAQFREVENFGDSRQANWLQSPYIPHSQVSEPVYMSPRNLLAPTRKALTALERDIDSSVDEFVATSLGISLETLSDGRLNAEQIDAVALGIRAIEKGEALIVADQGGTGKGRVLATLAAYCVKSGRKVMFLTEKPALFADFYRDAIHTHVDDVLANPFTLGSSADVRTMDGEGVLHSATPQEQIDATLRSGAFPQGHDLVLATYGQFNREMASERDVRMRGLVEAAEAVLRDGGGFDDIPDVYEIFNLDSPTYLRRFVDENDAPLPLSERLAHLNEIAAYDPQNVEPQERLYSRDTVTLARRELKLRSMRKSPLIKEMKALHRTPINAWRARWAIAGDAMQDVVVLADESHNAAGPNSMTGANVRAMLEKAGACVYSSTTYSKDESNLPLYARVFPRGINPDEISAIVAKGGTPLREILAGMLAEDGLMIRREHDMGSVVYRVVHDDKRRDQNIERKDAVARVLKRMSELAGEIKALVDQKNGPASERKAGTPTLSYTGPFSRFYSIARVFSVGLNVDQCVEQAVAEIQANNKPVLTLENTMESVLRELADMQGAEPDENGRRYLGQNLDFRDLLRRYAANMFSVYEVQRKGRTIVSKRLVSLTPPGMEQALEDVHAMIDQIPGDIPISPIDAFRAKIEAAGHSFVEVSGRTVRMSTDADGRQYLEPIPDNGPGASVRRVSRFNAGEVDVLMMSQSGSTGISAHSSAQFADTRQRTLLEMQPASNVRDRVQFFCRVFRADQVCPPEYVLPSSGLSHEQRLSMIQNTASRAMFASTAANADNMMVNKEVPDIMNDVGNEVCFRWLEQRPDVARLMGISLELETEDEDGPAASSVDAGQRNSFCGTQFVDRLTGRMFMLPSEEEAQAWDEIYAEYASMMERFEAEGYNPLETGRKDVRARRGESVIVEHSMVANNESVFAKPVLATELEYTRFLPALDPNEITNAMNTALERINAQTGDQGPKAWVTHVEQSARSLMKAIVDGSNWISVEHALSSDRHNAVKAASQRAMSIMSFLKASGPGVGGVFTLRDADFSGKKVMMLDIMPPKDTALYAKPALWRVKVLDVNEKEIKTLRLSSIMTSGEFMAHSASTKKKVLEAVAQAENRLETRVVYEGNLFLAAQICHRKKRGEPVSYSDHKGVWRQAFMMPEGFSMRHALDDDITLSDARLALDMLRDTTSDHGLRLTLSNTSEHKNRLYSIRVLDDGNLEIGSARSEKKELQAKRAMITRDEKLKELSVDGEFKGRGFRYIIVAPHNAKAAMERMIDLGVALQEPLSAPPWKRKWVDAFMKARREAEVDAPDRSRNLVAELAI